MQHSLPNPPARPRRGFTLVEIAIAVIVVAILAVAVVPLVLETATNSHRDEFVAELRSYIAAADLYRLRYHKLPEDSSTGVVPANLSQYLDTSRWNDGTPLGGFWDFELNSYNCTSAVGVHFMNVTVPNRSELAAIDAIIDDGNLSTGRFRQLATDRYYYIIEE